MKKKLGKPLGSQKENRYRTYTKKIRENNQNLSIHKTIKTHKEKAREKKMTEEQDKQKAINKMTIANFFYK